MRITELFNIQSIALDSAAADQAQIIDELVELQATHGNLTDKAAYKAAIYAREAEASTYVDNGITVPHARAACVTRPSLAALRLKTPVQYNADDDGKTDLLFMIAAPENGSLHIDMLARLMQMLMNEDFVAKLRAAKTPKEFLDTIDAQEEAQFGNESFTQEELPATYRVLAVTACPNGIAHTYMAAEALNKAAQKLGIPCKVETNGSDGPQNVLTSDEIAACDGIIVAADKNVETDRFDGKPVLFAHVDDGIHKPEQLLQSVLDGKVPVFHSTVRESDKNLLEQNRGGSAKDSLGHTLYKHLMYGISHMIPFVVVGGMPECVMQFAETKDYILVRHTQDTILASYLNDMSKYNNLNEIKKTRLAYDNITVQLSKKNTRFQYKLIKKGGRASEFENAIEWLCLSGIVSQVYKVEQIKKPLENYRDIDAFKIYVSDLGLLCAKKDLAANDILYMVEEINDFKGGMAENYVNVQLSINGYHTYYWESERGAEIDFIIQRDGQLIPIEVKSADNTRAKSLKVYMDTYKPAYAIKLSAKNFGFEDNKKIVPLYAAFCI